MPENCHIIDLEINNSIIQFNLNQQEQLNLFSYGYQKYKNFITRKVIKELLYELIDQAISQDIAQ